MTAVARPLYIDFSRIEYEDHGDFAQRKREFHGAVNALNESQGNLYLTGKGHSGIVYQEFSGDVEQANSLAEEFQDSCQVQCYGKLVDSDLEERSGLELGTLVNVIEFRHPKLP